MFFNQNNMQDSPTFLMALLSQNSENDGDYGDIWPIVITRNGVSSYIWRKPNGMLLLILDIVTTTACIWFFQSR
jgi:hypothetical protein